MKLVTLIGAYGRTYTTVNKALEDWQNGKDFQVYNGPYCSIRDMDYLMRTNNKIQILLNNGVNVVLHDTITNESLLDTIL